MSIGRPSTVTDTQREELWCRYKAGETVLGIASALGQRPTNLYRVLRASGGIAPAQRSRAPRVLSFGEREEISRGIAAGNTFRAIARSLKRAVSTVSQEVARIEQFSGHWEGDLVEGSRGTYIATLVERRSRFVILIKIPEKRTDVVVDALVKAVS